MPLIRVIKDWSYPDLMRQSPGSKGAWRDLQFTLQPVTECDYVIVCNRVSEATVVQCPPEHAWVVMQEPPLKELEFFRKGFDQFATIFTQDSTLTQAKYIHTQGALPWHVHKDYDFLKACNAPDKPKTLSWVTSNRTQSAAQKKRMAFLTTLRNQVEFDLWGQGFHFVQDKWDALAPYRYAIAAENYSGKHYWSEKLADCFLSWAMPIYWGCTNIADYFPPESFIHIDMEDRHSVKVIQEVIRSDLWLRNRDAIAYARELILDRYQFFPFVAGEIRKRVEARANNARPQELSLRALPWEVHRSFSGRIRGQAGSAKRRIVTRIRKPVSIT